MKAATEGRGVQSVEVGGRLLQVLVDAEQAMTLSEVAREAGLPAPQVHAYLVSFCNCELVEQDPRDGRYLIGPFALMLGISRMRSFDLQRIASDAMAALSTEADFTTLLSVWGTHGPTVLKIQEGTDPVYMNTRAGTVYSVSGTATGHIFAAFLPEATIKQAIKRELMETKEPRHVGPVMPYAKLKSKLPLIRYQGYETISQAIIPSVNAAAAPIFDHAGQVQMVVTIVGFHKLMDLSEESPAIAKLLKLTGYLSSQLGYHA